ncbi:MAG: hypothetical protein J2P36_37915 [Ktedonobacteraceae bacterium]|nr:hypothetical protein [Ktedonobacteraceae bacterium]
MFDGIYSSEWILSSMFDQASTSMARAAPEAEDIRERMKIRHTSFLLEKHLVLQDVEDVWK